MPHQSQIIIWGFKHQSWAENIPSIEQMGLEPRKAQEFYESKITTRWSCEILSWNLWQVNATGPQEIPGAQVVSCIHMKVGKGISLSTARQWLQCEGFKYTMRKKAIYYDGHDCLDVGKYRQEEFLPAMAEHWKRMVEYKIGEPTELLKKILPLGVQKLVLVAKDELTCTANDGPKIFVGPR
jgi:hypothetical protein